MSILGMNKARTKLNLPREENEALKSASNQFPFLDIPDLTDNLSF